LIVLSTGIALSRIALLIGSLGLLALSALYCLPNHVGAGDGGLRDGLAHVALFAAIGAWFGWFAGRTARVFVPLAVLAALLEVVQWRIGGYMPFEWRDVVANEAGLIVSFAWLWLRQALRNPAD
jgi:hypothetical protein